MKGILLLLLISMTLADTLFQPVEYNTISSPDLFILEVIITGVVMFASVIVGSLLTNSMAEDAKSDPILYLSAKLCLFIYCIK